MALKILARRLIVAADAGLKEPLVLQHAVDWGTVNFIFANISKYFPKVKSAHCQASARNS